MIYLYLKALHIIFVVTWFAGLFYIVRLYVYHLEATERKDRHHEILIKQFSLMERRLWYGITWPSAILTLILGSSMLTINNQLLHNGFMYVKLFLLLLLYLYHLSCHYLFVQIQKGKVGFTSTQMRWWNEVATLLLFSIVFVIVVRQAVIGLAGGLGLLGLSAILTFGIWVYKRLRKPTTRSSKP